MKTLIVCKHSKKDSKYGICTSLKNSKIKTQYVWKNSLSQKDLVDIDLVVSIGGDGTTLSASHYLLDEPLLTVNSSPDTSVGALTTLNIDNLENKLNQILLGKYKIEKLERIEVSINNKKQRELALNEVFIANEKPYLVSRYSMEWKNKKEEQLSSGIIFSTGTGSTAWFKSAGGKSFDPKSKFIKMIVREPYQNKINPFKISKAKINEKEKIKIKVLTPSTLAIDSIRELKLKKYDEITLTISNNPLKRVI